MQRRQEPWRWGEQWSAIGSWQWPTERITEAIPLTTTWEVAEELCIDHSMVIWHLKQIGKVKKLDKWVPHELTTSQNLLKSCLLLFYVTTTNHFLIGVWHVIKSGFYMITDEYQLSGWTEKKIQSISQSQTCTHKSPCSLFRGLLIHYNFMNPSETITSEKHAQQIEDSTWLHIAQPTLQKLSELDYEILPHPSYSLDRLPIDHHFFKHLNNFLQGKCFQN